MPSSLINRHSFLSSIMNLVKSNVSNQQMEHYPGEHIGHISVYHHGHMIVLSGFGGYKVRSRFVHGNIIIVLFHTFLYFSLIKKIKPKFKMASFDAWDEQVYKPVLFFAPINPVWFVLLLLLLLLLYNVRHDTKMWRKRWWYLMFSSTFMYVCMCVQYLG